MLSAAASTAAARRAAASGAGILTEGMSGVDRLRSITDAYAGAGGTGPKVLIRRAWVGEPPVEFVARQRAVYEGYAGAGVTAAGDQTLAADRPEELARRLHSTLLAVGADALNLRVHLPGVTPAEARGQIARLGDGVLPVLRELWAPNGL